MFIDLSTKIDLLFENIVQLDKYIRIICGDFNVDFLKENKYQVELYNLFQCYNGKYKMKEPSRISANSSTYIDENSNIQSNIRHKYNERRNKGHRQGTCTYRFVWRRKFLSLLKLFKSWFDSEFPEKKRKLKVILQKI